jgi:hypothetical protein
MRQRGRAAAGNQRQQARQRGRELGVRGLRGASSACGERAGARWDRGRGQSPMLLPRDIERRRSAWRLAAASWANRVAAQCGRRGAPGGLSSGGPGAGLASRVDAVEANGGGRTGRPVLPARYRLGTVMGLPVLSAQYRLGTGRDPVSKTA